MSDVLLRLIHDSKTGKVGYFMPASGAPENTGTSFYGIDVA